MKTLIACLLLALTSTHAFAAVKLADISCIARYWKAEKLEIQLPVTLGNSDEKTEYAGYSLAVKFYPGDQYEPQQLLSIEINGYVTQLYSLSKGLNTVEAPGGPKIQCYIKAAQ